VISQSLDLQELRHARPVATACDQKVINYRLTHAAQP
jgi:hypothetical protein